MHPWRTYPLGVTTEQYDPGTFALEFQRFLQDLHRLLPPTSDAIRDEIRQHMGVDPAALSSIVENLHPAEHPNLQLALDELVSATPSAKLLGLPVETRMMMDFSLSSLLAGRYRGSAEISPPEYRSVPVDIDHSLPCVEVGIWLLQDGSAPVVVLVVFGQRHTPGEGLRVEVAAPSPSDASRFLSGLRDRMAARNVYRGKVLSFSFSEWGQFNLQFHKLPAIGPTDIVLPAADLDAMERHTVGVARQATALLAAGRHIKRGLLLYGPPGTGKTYSVMYLCNLMPDRTTFLLSGVGEQVLGQAAALARRLAPSMVVLEDVDLVAAERTHYAFGANPLLFQLLNEMDGLAEDVDVIFVLTTNRVELLEPALANRPGRIDEAVEIKLPDAECRRRLFELYLTGLETDIRTLNGLIAGTEGVSPAFIKELVRRATLEAATMRANGQAVVVTGDNLESALHQLTARSTSVLRATLGGTPQDVGDRAN
jgi:hypothetical protein